MHRDPPRAMGGCDAHAADGAQLRSSRRVSEGRFSGDRRVHLRGCCMLLSCRGSVSPPQAPVCLEAHSSSILTGVVSCMQKTEPSQRVRQVAAVALLNSIKFCRENFSREADRNALMQVGAPPLSLNGTDLACRWCVRPHSRRTLRLPCQHCRVLWRLPLFTTSTWRHTWEPRCLA